MHIRFRRYKRFLFEVNAAAKIFPNTISEMLRDILGIKNLSGDIIIHEKTQADHDSSLRGTLNKSRAKLNRNKCLFSVYKLRFCGHVFSKTSISPDSTKIQTIINTMMPTSVSKVRSFLGMEQYITRFLPQYATIPEILRRVIKKTNPWK